MIKDIIQPEVTDIAMAVVYENTENNSGWFVFLLNLKDTAIRGVLVSSKGYGEVQGESVKTSILRHFFDEVPAYSFQKVEAIMEDVFKLSNEYWVSFYIGDLIYDKKFVFLPESISEENFSSIPFLGLKGVMIR
jgi:hypothetical protein